MQTSTTMRWQRLAIPVLLLLLLLRLIAAWALPLTDKTEARYGEIARKMGESGDWITLWHDYGVPFWAKPPLSTWLSAASMDLLGTTELAARLPSLLLALATLLLVCGLIRQRSGRDAALACALILGSGLLFLGTAGTVMTDSALLFCVTLSLVAVWRAVVLGSRAWGYLLFVGLGLGLLAKGPLAGVLVGLPVFFWVLLGHRWRALWQRLPWLTGIPLMLAIALPWYLLAEQRTPGLLNYFIVGEHLSRFLDAGWKGDKYGFAHATPRGMIWPYTLAALLPWSLVMLAWLVRHGRRLPHLVRDEDGWVLYLALWTLMTPLFFTLSGNIIFPYSMPMLPGCALLFAELWLRARSAPDSGSTLPLIAASGALLLAAVLAVNHVQGDRYLRTQKDVIAAWRAQHPSPAGALVYWSDSRAFSAEFYSQGRARTTEDPERLRAWLADRPGSFIVCEDKDRSTLPADIRVRYQPVTQVRNLGKTFLLLGETAPLPTPDTEGHGHD